jgi:hypothetical protein
VVWGVGIRLLPSVVIRCDPSPSVFIRYGRRHADDRRSQRNYAREIRAGRVLGRQNKRQMARKPSGDCGIAAFRRGFDGEAAVDGGRLRPIKEMGDVISAVNPIGESPYDHRTDILRAIH